MSSAMRRRFGRRATSAAAVAAVVVAGVAPVALAWDDAPQTGRLLPPWQSVGTIGIVDTDNPINRVNPGHPATHDGVPENTSNHGATLVEPGGKGQSIADIRFTLPNRFRSGDTVDLVLLDRSATEWEDRYTNKDADHSVAFSGAPTITVSAPKSAGTEVARDTESTHANNTETLPDTPWSPTGALGSDTRVTPSSAPKLSAEVQRDAGNQGNNQIRLTSTTSSLGDPSAIWVVTLSGLKVDLGPQVTPGELRVVPFAHNSAGSLPSYQNASRWFHSNTKRWDRGTPRAADDIQREIGIYTVPAWVAPAKVTGGTNLVADGVTQNVGTITITENAKFAIGDGTYCLNGAGFTSRSFAGAKVTVSGGSDDEVITPINADGCFTLSGTDPRRISTITITGVTAATNASGQLGWWLTGGTITDTGGASWFHSPAGSSTLTIDVADGTGEDIWPDCAFAWQTLASTTQRPCPTQGCEQAVPVAVTFSSMGIAGPTVAYQGAAVRVSPTAGPVRALESGVYTVNAAGDKIYGPNGFTAERQGTTETWRSGNYLYTIVNTRPAMRFTITATTGATQTTYTVANVTVPAATPVPVVETLGNALDNPPDPLTPVPAGTYTVRPGTATGAYNITLPGGVVLQNVRDGEPFTAADGVQWIFTNFPKPATGSATFEIAAGAITTTFGYVAADRAPAPCAVNQKDIVAPALAVYNQANAPSARIGGANRFSTAAKIAAAWTLSVPGSGTDFHNVNFGGGRARNVIIASGENFPDALSASYMSSRVEAPILLSGKNWLPKETVEALRDRFVEKVYIVGGEAAVSDSVEKALKDLPQYVPENITNPLTVLEWINLTAFPDLRGMFRDILLHQTAPKSADQPALGVWFNAPKPSGAKLQVERLGGSTRYTTNQIVNMYAAAWGGNMTIGRTIANFGEASKYTAILARGDNYPDALTGGILTAGIDGQGGQWALPLILTEPSTLSAPAKAQFDNMDVQHMLVIGSPAAISDGVETAVKALGVSTRRLGGVDRYATAGEVAKYALTPALGTPATAPVPNPQPGLNFASPGGNVTDWSPWAGVGEIAWLATGLKYPDALTAAPFVGSLEDVIALVWRDTIPDNTKSWLSALAPVLDRAVGLGMGEVVSTKVIDQANALVSAK